MKKILVIKHGALGDIVFALHAMYAIRNYHKNSIIHLLTENRYTKLLEKSKYFDRIIKDDRKVSIYKTLNILFNLKREKYDLIIDLQNSKRTQYYNLFFKIFSSAIICSSKYFAHHRYHIPAQGDELAKEGLFNQLKLINIKKTDNLKLDWLKCNINEIFKKPIVLMIPGVSKNNFQKQWHPENFARLALYCEQKNYQICIVGTNQDRHSCEPIIKICNHIINKIDKSPPEVIYSLALLSVLIITNDTGPGHIASLSNKNILWIANDNRITNANISKTKNNYLLSEQEISSISSEQAIKFIEKNSLL